MKKNDLSRSDEASTFSLLLTLILIGVIAYIVIRIINTDFDEFFNIGSGAGEGLWGAVSGAASGFFGGAWKTGKAIGTKWNPVTTWRNSSNRDDGKWYTFW